MGFRHGFFALWFLAFALLCPAPAVGEKSQVSFASPVTYSAGLLVGSVAVADLRGNGNLDLVVANFCETVDQQGYCTQAVRVESRCCLATATEPFSQR